MGNYSHIVSIDAEKKSLMIYRLFDDSRKEFLTACNIEGISSKNDWDKFAEFARQLGENILMDSPMARKIMDL